MLEYIIVIVISILILLVFKFAFNIKIKDIKKVLEIAKSKNDIKTYVDDMSDEEITKEILGMLGNETTNVKMNDSKESTTCLYIAISDTIWIPDMSSRITRIQTIAHECVHSIQDRAVLLFNYIFTNIYLLYFFVSVILLLFPIIKEQYVHSLLLVVFIFLSFIDCCMKIHLENDAMIRARYIARDYMIRRDIPKEDIDKIIRTYDDINPIGIKLYDYKIIFNSFIKIIILAACCLF